MKFSVDTRIFEKFPGLHIGVVVAKGVDNTGASPELAQALRAQEAAIRSRFKAEQLGDVPQIAAWRAAYVSFGAKPKEHRSSIENLCRLVLNGVQLRAISKLVDAYNGISLKHLVPVGGEDLDKMQGDL